MPKASYGKGKHAHSKFIREELRKGEHKDDAELEAIEKEVEQHEDDIDAAKLRMLRMAASTVEQGAATLEQMEAQGEQMKRIQTDQAKVQQNLDTSDKILKGMTSFLGWRAWGQSSTTSGKGKAQAVYTKHEAASKGGGKGGAGGGGAGGGGFSGGVPEEGEEGPDAMDHISNMMATMHQQALAMQSELKGQSSQLDTLVDTTQNQQSQVGKSTRKTAAVGGKKAKKEMNEGALSTAQEMASRVVEGKPPISARMAAMRAMQG
mmetsp:Transcript_5385/g.14172  ORF Transcript_5385/g.14172 Transcript_5385/m.14172 type:complete len:263 (-) Transcript_5385:489-1277(-)